MDRAEICSDRNADGRNESSLAYRFEKGGIKNTMTRQEAVNFLVKKPYKFGQMVGFSKLTDVHNGWMRHMLTGDKDYTLQGHRG